MSATSSFGALARLLVATGELSSGSPQAWVDLPAGLMSVALLILLGLKPRWFVGIVNAALFDDYESASVLSADVVDFTPMSTRMTPPELVGLLNTVFTPSMHLSRS